MSFQKCEPRLSTAGGSTHYSPKKLLRIDITIHTDIGPSDCFAENPEKVVVDVVKYSTW